MVVGAPGRRSGAAGAWWLKLPGALVKGRCIVVGAPGKQPWRANVWCLELPDGGHERQVKSQEAQYDLILIVINQNSGMDHSGQSFS